MSDSREPDQRDEERSRDRPQRMQAWNDPDGLTFAVEIALRKRMKDKIHELDGDLNDIQPQGETRMAKYRDVIRDATGEYVSGKHEGDMDVSSRRGPRIRDEEVALTGLAECGRSTGSVEALSANDGCRFSFTSAGVILCRHYW